MTGQELATAMQYGAKTKIVISDNGTYGTIRAHQEKRGRPTIGTDLGPVDSAGVARAFGAHGATVENDEAFEPALRDALAQQGPSVLHLHLDRRWLSIDKVSAD